MSGAHGECVKYCRIRSAKLVARPGGDVSNFPAGSNQVDSKGTTNGRQKVGGRDRDRTGDPCLQRVRGKD